MRALVIFFALVIVPVQAGWAAARSIEHNPHFRRGVAHLEAFEDRQALKVFKEALKWPENSAADRAAIHLYLGITHFNLLEKEEAAEQLRAALTIDPQITLPDDASPVIRDYMEQLREEMAAEQPAQPPADDPSPSPSADATSMADFSSMETTADGPSSGRRYWPAWTALGLGLAAGGAGIALGVMMSNRAEEADDPTLPYPQALDKHEEARDLGLGANILFGVAGAAAIAAGVLFYVGAQDDGDVAQVSAAVTPLDGGGALVIRAAGW